MEKLIRYSVILVAALVSVTAAQAQYPSCWCARFNNFADHGCHKSPQSPGGAASGANDPNGNKSECPTCPDGTPAGMPRWWVSEPYINLHIADVPLSYTTSSGQPMEFRMTYKQDYQLPTLDQVPNFHIPYSGNAYRDYDTEAENSPCSSFFQNMQCFGGSPEGAYVIGMMTNAAWIHNWQGAIVLWDAQWESAWDGYGTLTSVAPFGDGSYEALSFMDDGGIDYFTSMATNQTLNNPSQSSDPISQAQLVPFPNASKPTPFYTGAADSSHIYWGARDSSGHYTNGFAVVYPDGSSNIYGITGCVSNLRVYAPYADSTAYALLTAKVDAQGRMTRLGYATNGFTNACTGSAAGGFFRVKYVVDSDGLTNTFVYRTNGYWGPELQEIDDPFGRKITFGYEGCGAQQKGWLSSITDAQGNSNSFAYQSGGSGWISSMTTPYGTTSFYYEQEPAAGYTNVYTNRAVYVTEPEGAGQLYCYIHNAGGAVESSAAPPIVPGATFDTGTNGGPDQSLHYRNSFHWDRHQFADWNPDTNFLEYQLQGAIDDLTNNPQALKLATMKRWLVGSDDFTLTETLSSERDPSPDNAGNIEGQRTWYAYGNSTPADMFSTDSVLAVGTVLSDGTGQYTRYVYGFGGDAPWVVTQNAQSYTKPGGGVGEFTNYFNYTAPDYADVTHITNNLGQFVNIGYNSARQPAAVTNALGQVTTAKYDSNSHNLTNINYDSGASVGMIYNGGGGIYLSQIAYQPQGLTINIPTYSAALPTVIQATGTGVPDLWITNTWDGLNRLTSVHYPDATYISNIYTALDLTAHKDRLNNWTYHKYDGLEHLIFTTDARGNITQYTWCGCGSLTGISNALGNITYLNYNNQELLTNVNFPDGSSLNWQFDLLGRVTNRFDGSGRNITYAYNNQGQVTAVSNAYGQVWGVYYDALGRPITVTNINNVVTSNAYDPLNRLLTRAWLGGGTESFGYSSNGLVAYTNQDGMWTTYTRDGAGRAKGMTNAVQTKQFIWNDLDELSRYRDGNHNYTYWGYNQYGWFTSKTNAELVNVVSYVYDADGRVTNRRMVGTNTGYTYDAVGNLKSTVYPTLTITNAYDAINQLTNMIDGVGTNRFTYTPTGQLASETELWTGGGSNTVSYGYSQGHRTNLSLTQPSGSPWTQSYSYDDAWRLYNTTTAAGSFDYTLGGASAASPLIKSIALPNNAIITNGYDGLGRMTATALNNQWGHPLDGYVYGLDAIGLVTNMTRKLGLTTNTVTISYDPIGELDSWAGREPGGGLRHNEQFSFGYDAGGNLIVRTNDAFLQYFDVNNLSQLFLVSNTGSMTVTGSVPAPASAVTVNGIGADLYSDLTFAATNLRLISGLNAYTIAANNLYDVQAQTGVTELNLPIFAINADIIGRIEDAAEGKLSYDSENQLDSVVSVPWHWSVSFTYDGLGRRRINEQTSNGSTITNELHYIYDGMQVLQERDSNNVPQVTYTRGLDSSLSLDGAGGIGGLLARTDANGSAYYHADGNGNITALMDGNQNIAARYEYGPYGKMLGEWGPLANANRYRFSSKEQDVQTGLYYYGNRFYSPNLQRWMTPDPLGEAGGFNLYQFVGNDPVNRIDPWGLLVTFPTSAPAALAEAGAVTGTAAEVGGGLSVAGIAGAVSAGVLSVPAGFVATDSLFNLGRDAELNPYGVNGPPSLPDYTAPGPQGGTVLGPGEYRDSDGNVRDSSGDLVRDKNNRSVKPCPKLVHNPKHHPNSINPEPSDVEELFKNSIPDDSGRHRWAVDEDGEIHRFSNGNDGTYHWSGSTGDQRPIQEQNIPPEIRKQLSN